MPRVIDSSRHSLSFKCPQARQWAYEYKRRGVTALETKEDTDVGSGLHEGIESLVTGKSLAESYELMCRYFRDIKRLTLDGEAARQEWEWHGYGVLQQFERTVLQTIRERYKVLAIEQELVIKLTDDWWWLTRPDFMVEFLETGARMNINIKSSRYTSDMIKNYEFSTQLAMEAKASAAHWGKDYAGTLLLVVDKCKRQGPLKQDGEKKGYRLQSPFCYVWQEPDSGIWGAKWRTGLVKIPAWKVCSSPQQLIDHLPEQDQMSYLLGPVVVPFSNRIVDEILEQEELIAEGYSARNRDACNNFGGYGYACQYKPLCWEGNKWHLFEPREFNHPLEETLYNANRTEGGGTCAGEGQEVRGSEIQL